MPKTKTESKEVTKKEPTKKAPKTPKLSVPTLEEMVKAGVHFGHRVSRWHPKMAPFIFGQKETVHIIDLDKTQEKLEEALEFIKRIVKAGGVILFVGTKVAARQVVEEIAKETEMPYVSERWLGGTITNFVVISKRLKYFRDLEAKVKSGELKKYTKKEQHDFRLALQKLERHFGGIKNLERLPEAVFVFDSWENKLALKEARMRHIPTIALCDTNIDPSIASYPIPANDDAITSLKLIAQSVIKVIKKYKKQNVGR